MSILCKFPKVYKFCDIIYLTHSDVPHLLLKLSRVVPSIDRAVTVDFAGKSKKLKPL